MGVPNKAGRLVLSSVQSSSTHDILSECFNLAAFQWDELGKPQVHEAPKEQGLKTSYFLGFFNPAFIAFQVTQDGKHT